MNKRAVILFMIFLGSLSLAIGAYGYFRMGASRQRKRGMGHFEKETLKLTDEQKKNKDELYEKMCADMQPLREKSRQKRLELMELLSHEAVDSYAIETKLKEISQIQSDMQRCMVEHLIEMKNVLTPEQQSKFFETMCAGLCGETECSHPRKRAGKCSPQKQADGK